MENAFTGTGITHGTASFDISNDIQSIYNNHTVMRRLVFFGMNYFQKESKTSTPLDFNIVFGTRDIVYVASDNKQNISGFYLYFNTIITCQSDQVWNATAEVCQNCLSNQYISNNTCIGCDVHHSNCTTCNESQCITCDTPYLVNVTDCFLCEQAWSNCSQCDTTGCSACANPYVLNNTHTCFLCRDAWTNCDTCDNTTCLTCITNWAWDGTNCFQCVSVFNNCTSCNVTACLSCQTPYELSLTNKCFLCNVTWPNCLSCNANGCLTCADGYAWNGTDCFLCSNQFVGCDNCTNSSCLNCVFPFRLNGTVCQANCTLIDNCLSCVVNYWVLSCVNCSSGFEVDTYGQCSQICGDGIVVTGLEGCDDANTENGDGCSASCQVQQYFVCNGTAGASGFQENSTCILIQFDATLRCMAKNNGKNEVILTIDIFP